jgi:hypothetical protein
MTQPLARLVDEKIIKLARRGVRDTDTLVLLVLKDLQPGTSPG